MSLDKYQQAWKAEASQVQVTFDADLLSKEVQQSHDTFRSMIFWRDVREVGTSLVMIPIWFVMGIGMSLPWTWYLTVPALLWIAGFMLVDRRRHPQRPSDPGEPLLFYVKESRAQVEHQIWLLRNVFWWYLLPPSISIMAFFTNVAWDSSESWLGFIFVAGFEGIFLFLLYGWVYRLNQRAVRDQLEPRRIDLQKLITYLEGESPAEDSSEMIDIVSALSGTDGNAGLSPNWARWAENWNRIIPSWREVAIILVPTLVGASLGFRFPLTDMGPVFFQSVVAAVIPFEIAFFGLWYLSYRRHKEHPFSGKGSVRLNTPAIVTIVMITVISTLAFAAIFSCFRELMSRRGPGLDDISAFVDDDIKHIDTWLQSLTDSSYPSLSAVVVRDGEIVYQGAVGFEDIEIRRPATARTQYHVASVTKVFTASLAVMLHEQGVIDLDQAAASYLPNDVRISTTPELGATITLRQLASHTSGLPSGVPGQVQSVEGRYELEPQRLYDHLASVELISNPGDGKEYSNLGFGLLGHVLERAANKPIDRLLQEMLCDPLQLNNTAIEGDAKLHPATGYARKSRGGAVQTRSLQERLAGSGGLVTTTEDLGKFLIAQMKPGVFSNEMLGQLHTETKLPSGSPSGTALGWSVKSIDGVGRILEKNGSRSNCSAWIGFSPEDGVGVAVVTNCGGPIVDPIGRKLLERSISLSQRKLVTKDGYAKVAPYTGVRWENGRPIVRVHDRWTPLVSIDGIPIDRIMDFANQEYGEIAHKRFAEDLVEVLSTMGHEPKWELTLGLESTSGQVEQLPIRMTEQNRKLAQKYLRDR
ncbi:serine hydrolase domain-containing protein [Neorhodopirellula pilleata]|uniref:D-alanyl-D-alanine-carboxypeptidase/endopeptidase AmpH n=1 Tax=Neorhodopirellula pilleata TaxID=2714738 RepID=A0A5C5ZI69_9BACT|nr:serine hydrolase domain-containing protein [Neorhodopirellula pilleata]TWT87072.1 D-alanyl-D-alanine-carboxypeptidase/endopeptidase AmpH precursor [Neorhodopirellula pilleata]